MKNAVIGLLAFVAIGCSNKVDTSEINELLADVRTNNELIIEEINKTPALTSDDAELRVMIAAFHKEVISFMDTIDLIDNSNLDVEINKLKQRTFLKYPLELPTDLEINGGNRALIKLQLATLEGTYLRESRSFNVMNTLRMDTIQAIVIPDKVIYKRGERISGRVTLAVYAREIGSVNAKITMNDQHLDIKNGQALFFFTPGGVGNSGSGTVDLIGKIDIGGQVFNYTSTVLIVD